MNQSVLSSSRRRAILASLSATGVALTAPSATQADIIVANPNTTVAFGGTTSYTFSLGSYLGNGALMLETHKTANPNAIHSLLFVGGAGLKMAGFNSNRGTALPTGAGKHFATIGSAQQGSVRLATRSHNGGGFGNFSNEYYSFTFKDAASQVHYGWIYGSLIGGNSASGYAHMGYLIGSYAYETVAGEEIITGQTAEPNVVPEPSSLVLSAMGALVMGAAGVRKWKKDKAAVSAAPPIA